MLRQKIVERLSHKDMAIHIEQSRCLRTRFNKSSCKVCRDHCLKDGIHLNGGVAIDQIQCSECMLCVSSCPSSALRINIDIVSLIPRLGKSRSPMIGCYQKPDVLSHEKTPCLGFLSEEILIAFSVFLKRPLQVNLTECAACENGYIRDFIKERMKRIKEKTAIDIEKKIRLVEKKEDLDFQHESMDRRGFLKKCRTNVSKEVFWFFKKDDVFQNGKNGSYGNKKTSLKKELLNRCIPVLSEKQAEGVLRNYYFTPVVNENCKKCFACVGACPAGALEIDSRDGSDHLLINASLCCGCGLCESFCMHQAISVENYQGFHPFALRAVERQERPAAIPREDR